MSTRVDLIAIYVHVAENHRRVIPQRILEAASHEPDSDRRVLKMLSARASHVQASAGRGVQNGEGATT